MSIPVNEVWDALMSERSYQKMKWNHSASSGQPGNGERTIDEYALYITEYAAQLRHLAGTALDPKEKLDAVRKVTALGMACMEEHGAPLREWERLESNSLSGASAANRRVLEHDDAS